MDSFFNSITFSALIVALIFAAVQLYYFFVTWHSRTRFNSFFYKTKKYETSIAYKNGESFTQLVEVGKPNSDLNNLIQEINHYVLKTKGTTDFAVIQNKVERKLNMRYDQSTVFLSFPTYVGLMGTFAGVFMGIFNFLGGFDSVEGITDSSIQALLNGVLVSMVTSLFGLFLTTINNGFSGSARKKIEEDKNDFFDFVQTELMPSLDVSLVSAITKLHETVDKFEPAFDGVINRFQTTFDTCTKAFGDNFEKNVVAVAGAVDLMGQNMDKINQNIELQKELITTMQSDHTVKGMERFIEASDHFVGITQSLNKFEEARRMMLAAAQETIVLQNQYAESMKVPREMAIRINQILDRIVNFENSLKEVSVSLKQREILGNDIVNAIKEQVDSIAKKNKISEKYLDIADGKLEDLFVEQTKSIDALNKRYKDAISQHIDGFEEMMTGQTEELKNRHKAFMLSMEENLSIESIRKEFTALRTLEPIEDNLKKFMVSSVSINAFEHKLKILEDYLTVLNKSTETLNASISQQSAVLKSLVDSQKQMTDQLVEIKKNTVNKGALSSLFGR